MGEKEINELRFMQIRNFFEVNRPIIQYPILPVFGKSAYLESNRIV
jgi:hypothetical protein